VSGPEFFDIVAYGGFRLFLLGVFIRVAFRFIAGW
jgi:hypothetical protein